MATKEEAADIKTEMMEQFEHVDKQFHALDGRLRDMANEIAVIHRRVERLEELGASNAGFAKEMIICSREWPKSRSTSGSTRRLRGKGATDLARHDGVTFVIKECLIP